MNAVDMKPILSTRADVSYTSLFSVIRNAPCTMDKVHRTTEHLALQHVSENAAPLKDAQEPQAALQSTHSEAKETSESEDLHATSVAALSERDTDDAGKVSSTRKVMSLTLHLPDQTTSKSPAGDWHDVLQDVQAYLKAATDFAGRTDR